MQPRTFFPGFRLSALDVGILVAGALLAGGVASVDRWIGCAIAFVVLHFFFFCNILRLPRRLELLWTGFFLALSAVSVTEVISWPIVFAIALAGSIGLAILHARNPSYHGVFWKLINPYLPQWWAAQQETASHDPPSRA